MNKDPLDSLRDAGCLGGAGSWARQKLEERWSREVTPMGYVEAGRFGQSFEVGDAVTVNVRGAALPVGTHGTVCLVPEHPEGGYGISVLGRNVVYYHRNTELLRRAPVPVDVHGPKVPKMEPVQEPSEASTPVSCPSRSTSSSSEIECIDVVEHMSFNRGSAIKYIWHAGLRGDEIEDIRRAAMYCNREVERLEKLRAK